MRTVYLDHNATTPLDPEVRAAMLPFLGEFYGNPSSIHHVGQRARVALDEARERAAAVWGCKPSEITFTSGGTESNSLAVLGAARRLKPKGRHLITSSVEHHAVLRPMEYLAKAEGFTLTHLPVDGEGRIDPADLERALRPDTILVSLMAANNEVGTVQPVAEAGAICQKRGIVFHTDAAQWFGKEPFASIQQFNADLVTLCAHKFYGPKGAGALYVRSPLQPESILWGGAQENERRAGTENVAAILGLVEAMERFLSPPVLAEAHLAPLRERLMRLGSRTPYVRLCSPLNGCLANTTSFVVEGADATSILAGLDLEGICASSGSACSAGSLEPSHVLVAMGLGPELARSLVRFSLGRQSTASEIDAVEYLFPEVVRRTRLSCR